MRVLMCVRVRAHVRVSRVTVLDNVSVSAPGSQRSSIAGGDSLGGKPDADADPDPDPGADPDLDG